MPTKPKRKRKNDRLSRRQRMLILLGGVSFAAISLTVIIVASLGLEATPPIINYEPNFITGELLDIQQVTSLPADETHPAWSPDGAQLAFIGHAAGNPDIYTVNVDSGDVTQITDRPDDDYAPSWVNPDRLRYQQRPGADIYEVDLQSQRSVFASPPPETWPPRWLSHSGDAYIIKDDQPQFGDDALYWGDANTGAQDPIFSYDHNRSEGTFISDILWSPGDTKVLFSYRVENNTQDYEKTLYVYDRMTYTYTPLYTLDGQYNSHIANIQWINENELLYSTSLYDPNSPAYVLFRHNLVLGTSEVIAEGDLSLTRVLQSPSGTYLYLEVLSPRCEGRDTPCRYLMFYNLLTGESHWRMLHHMINDATFIPGANPDVLVFSTYAGVYKMQAETGVWDNFIYGRAVYRLRWSPNGRYLVVQAGSPIPENYTRETLIWDMTTDNLYTLGHYVPWLGGVTWSPDERQIAFSAGTGGEKDLYVATLPKSASMPLALAMGM